MGGAAAVVDSNVGLSASNSWLDNDHTLRQSVFLCIDQVVTMTEI